MAFLDAEEVGGSNPLAPTKTSVNSGPRRHPVEGPQTARGRACSPLIQPFEGTSRDQLDDFIVGQNTERPGGPDVGVNRTLHDAIRVGPAVRELVLGAASKSDEAPSHGLRVFGAYVQVEFQEWLPVVAVPSQRVKHDRVSASVHAANGWSSSIEFTEESNGCSSGHGERSSQLQPRRFAWLNALTHTLPIHLPPIRLVAEPQAQVCHDVGSGTGVVEHERKQEAHLVVTDLCSVILRWSDSKFPATPVDPPETCDRE
jgi:hypothetical protein